MIKELLLLLLFLLLEPTQTQTRQVTMPATEAKIATVSRELV
jgi:hypothetical protein